MNKTLSVLRKLWSSIVVVVQFIFSNNTIETVGTGIYKLLKSAFRYAGVSHRTATFIFIGLAALLGYGVYTSVISVIKLEGFIIFPAIWGLAKLALFLSFLYSWILFSNNSRMRKNKTKNATLK